MVPAAIRVTGQEEVATPEGSIPTWRVDVTFRDTGQTYWFERDYPNILVRFQSSDGRSLTLKRRERRTYW